MPILLPNDYGYVLLAASSTFFVNTYHGILTSSARKASGIKYPAAYAANEVADKDPKAHSFNCAQRAHANFTEVLTPALGAVLIAGLRFPIAAASLGGIWATARVAYAYGYTKKGPQGRVAGSLVSSLADLALKILAVWSAVTLVQDTRLVL